ncbi:uncharacterized protein EV154DRAFT_498856 [Mucor mucedo]|uniref:uncharacterized protein n=1 Tax=Mucor mucedo TaxID=29922 RepID=UPI00221EA814|nr:uncharacterized protein EV154DRAFT_498856 [Mucor mucedo]KAI7894488.1 hypothetical protein EV154DRAFT_498856 [Mucor mucedo]
MINNKYLKMTFENNQIRNEIAMVEDLSEVDNDTLQHVDSNYEGVDNQEGQSTYNIRKQVVDLELETNYFIKGELVKLKNIEAVCGESASLGCKKRMNKKRAIGSITKATRLRYGHKCDIIFRQYSNGHSVPLELGACEAKSIIEDESGTNFREEGFFKLPRILKDMLDCLLQEINFDDRSTAIRTVGFIHSGLSSTLIKLDRPTKYISRVSRCSTLKISSSVVQFGSTVLPVILSTWVCCEMVKEVFKIISQDKEVNEDDISLFDNFLERTPLPAMPATSASSETAQKRLKSKH